MKHFTLPSGLFLLFAFLSVFVSCSSPPMLYRPTPHHTALLKKQGEIHANASAGNWGGQGHFSFAMSDHFSVQMNGALIDKKRYLDRTQGKEYLFEGGLGFQRMVKDSLHWEIFGLMGQGRMQNHIEQWFLLDTKNAGDLEATVNTRTIQSSFTFIEKYGSVSIGSRLRRVEFSELEGNLTYENLDYVRFLRKNPRHYFFEPSLTCRVGWPNIQVSVQWIWSSRITPHNLHHYPLSMSLGLHFIIK